MPDVEPWNAAKRLELADAMAVEPALHFVATRLQAREKDAVEPALAYLEADLWKFRTGYVKERLLRSIGRNTLTSAQRRRLRAVLLRYTGLPGRGEFRSACVCARQVGGRELRDGLIQVLHHGEQDAPVRALRMLLHLKRPRLSAIDLDVARATLVSWADRQERGWNPRWVGGAVRRLWSPTWQASLQGLAAAEPSIPGSDGARTLLWESRNR